MVGYFSSPSIKNEATFSGSHFNSNNDFYICQSQWTHQFFDQVDEFNLSITIYIHN